MFIVTMERKKAKAKHVLCRDKMLTYWGDMVKDAQFITKYRTRKQAEVAARVMFGAVEEA